MTMVGPPQESVDAQPQAAVTVDPYADHEQWCEALHKTSCECPGRDKMHCKEPKVACPADRTGRTQLCSRPYWSRREGSFAYHCAPPWLNRTQQKKQRVSQAIIIENLCHPPGWWSELQRNHPDHDPDKQCWRLKGGSKALRACREHHYCNPVKLAKLTALVAARESTWDNETTHESNFDVEANQNAYYKAKKRGWYEGSPHFYDVQRWQQGYGWYGMNAALHTYIWDKHAPPEVLCRQVESTEVYLRKARGSFKKLWSRYKDDVERTYKLADGTEVQVKGVTWYDIHRAASSGKLDPQEVIPVKKGFVYRARSKKIKLDPFETVMWEMLGEAIPRDQQNQIAEDIRQEIIQHFEPQASNDAEYTGEAVGG